MQRGDENPPGDSEADKAADLAIAVTWRAGDTTLGVTLEAVLASVSVGGRLAVETSLLVPRGVRVPSVPVTRQAPRLQQRNTLGKCKHVIKSVHATRRTIRFFLFPFTQVLYIQGSSSLLVP